jgi:hypothetical protein
MVADKGLAGREPERDAATLVGVLLVHSDRKAESR